MAKIGLYFGSFNPLHNGHLNIANYVVDYMNLDKLLLIVSPNNPFKNPRSLCDVNVRIEMVKAAIAKFPKLEVSDIEVLLSQPSYTINTIEKLISIYEEETEFYLIMGLDNWMDFDRWKDFDIILKKVKIIVLPRISSAITSIDDCLNRYEKTKSKLENIIKTEIDSIFLSHSPIMTISSTFIRNHMDNKDLVREYVPSEVYDILYELKLYKDGG